MEGDGRSKGTVCVTGGTGYLASWLIFKLLQHGYSVNTTIRSSPGRERDVSYLTNLPGASERLRIFHADLGTPESFGSPIEGCIGVFHVAHPMDVIGKESEEEVIRKAIDNDGTLGILQACLNAKTVKRVVYTSSASTIMFNNDNKEIVDEETWSDSDKMRSKNSIFGTYSLTKTLTEKASLEFGEKHGLDVVTIIPPWITGPFICPNFPHTVRSTMAMIFGNEKEYKNLANAAMVHTDDLAEAHIFLLEYPLAKGRYICFGVATTVDKIAEFLFARYPEYQIPSPDSLKEIERRETPSFSSKKLLDTGFKYKYGLEEIYGDAIKCCKEKGFL